MESYQKEAVDGREEIPNPATTPPPPKQRHMVTTHTQAHRPIILPPSKSLFHSLVMTGVLVLTPCPLARCGQGVE